MYNITTSIVDIDATGKTSTIFRLDIENYLTDKVEESHAYSLLDELNGKIDLNAITAPYKTKNEERREQERKQRESEKQTLKQSEFEALKKENTAPKEVIEQIDYVMTLPIAKNINEKSINALVGMVLKKHKFNPQIVKELIKERANP